MNVAIYSICLQSLGFRDRSMWSFERQSSFVDQYLLRSFTEKMFKERTRVLHSTFMFLCEKLGSFFLKTTYSFDKTNFCKRNDCDVFS